MSYFWIRVDVRSHENRMFTYLRAHHSYARKLKSRRL
jgi:hypothetical protein